MLRISKFGPGEEIEREKRSERPGAGRTVNRAHWSCVFLFRRGGGRTLTKSPALFDRLIAFFFSFVAVDALAMMRGLRGRGLGEESGRRTWGRGAQTKTSGLWSTMFNMFQVRVSNRVCVLFSDMF